MFEIRALIPADHPSMAGHFPDEPIVPGVVILDQVVGALATAGLKQPLRAIPLVKFLRPLRPDQPFTISLAKIDNRTFDFCCRSGDETIAEGRLQLGD
jgi:3-hydroxyacyl-[acyl-carrier-protein] dehydratase